MEPTPPAELEFYPFEAFDLVRRRWVKARHVATLEDLGRDGCPFRIIGAPERREVHEAGSLTAGHLARGKMGLPS